jgi:ribose transport system substrate-binding protein
VPRRRLELGVTISHLAASHWGRREVLAAFFATLTMALAGAGQRRFRVAFANLNDDPSVRVEGLGFNGAEVRRSFELASRTLPVDMIYYDNAGDPEAALANALDAIGRKVDLFIEYNSDAEANAEIARKLKAAAIPVLALNYPVPGAPLYAADNLLAGQIAGKALGEFAKQTWADQTVVAVIAGDLADPAAYLPQRVQGIIDGMRKNLPDVTMTRLDTSGNPVRVDGLLSKFLASQPRTKVLVATLDDPTALAAKGAIERAGRIGDCIVVSQGLDHSVHGGANEKKEIDPNNRGSLILGSIAYYVDRYGYEVLPLAMKMLDGEQIPARTSTRHILVSAKNVFTEYPPYDMN